MARKYDDFDEPEGSGVFDQILTIVGERKREFAIVSVSAAVILLGLVVWGSYPDEQDNGSASVPIVRADAGDYKTAPDNPGGMEIPYRDSTVFSSLGNENASRDTENILAEDTTEQPVPRSQLFAGLNTEEPVVSTADMPRGEVEDVEASMEKAQNPAETNEALVKEAIGTAPAEEKLAAAPTIKAAPVEKAAEEETAAKTEPAAGASVAAKGITPGGYFVQVGSVRSESGADSEWKKIQAKYSAQLSGLRYRVQEANLGAKGTFYRIQAGPMSKESADKICGEMKTKAAGSCLVTK